MLTFAAISASLIMHSTAIRQFDFGRPNPPKQFNLPKTHRERARLAERLVDLYPYLDIDDHQKLIALGDDAYQPLLRLFLKATAYKDARADARYWQSTDPGTDLTMVASKHRASELLALVSRLGPNSIGWPDLVDALERCGPEEKVIPLCTDALSLYKGGDQNSNLHMIGAIRYLKQSKHPDATRFWIQTLESESANPELRTIALTHLATVGDEGVQAVAAAMSAAEKRYAERNSDMGLKPAKTDADLALASAFATVFMFSESQALTLVVLPLGVKPFALSGGNGFITVTNDSFSGREHVAPTSDSVTAYVSHYQAFFGMREAGRFTPPPPDPPGIQRVSISVSQRARPDETFIVTLKQFGSAWLPIDLSRPGPSFGVP